MTAPRPPRTGHSLAGCYAALLNDCDTKVSKEHYVSEVLLRHLNLDDGLRVSGLSWQAPDETHRIAPAALATRMLCRRHNSALSVLDSVAMRIFQSLDERGASGSGTQQLSLFNGHDLERWLLKVLCGLAFSGNARFEREVDTAISVKWLLTLFGQRDFEAGHGLYVRCQVGERFEGPRGLRINPLASGQRLFGIIVSVCGYDLVLSLKPLGDRMLHGVRHAYRPFEFYTAGERFEKSVVFCWDGPADNGTISLRIAGAEEK